MLNKYASIMLTGRNPTRQNYKRLLLCTIYIRRLLKGMCFLNVYENIILLNLGFIGSCI